MATLFSSNSFVFYPSAAMGNSLRIGLSLIAFSLMTPIVIWVFIPVYARLKVETLPYGSWAILIGVFLEGLSAFGADQVVVQRYLSARSERTSQWGALLNLAAMWIVLPGLLLIGVGLFSYFTHHSAELGSGALGGNPGKGCQSCRPRTS